MQKNQKVWQKMQQNQNGSFVFRLRLNKKYREKKVQKGQLLLLLRNRRYLRKSLLASQRVNWHNLTKNERSQNSNLKKENKKKKKNFLKLRTQKIIGNGSFQKIKKTSHQKVRQKQFEKRKQQGQGQQVEFQKYSQTQLQFYVKEDLIRGAHPLVRIRTYHKQQTKTVIKKFKKSELTYSRLERIKTQQEILQSITHKNIIGLTQVIHDNQEINVIMEYDGRSTIRQHLSTKEGGIYPKKKQKQYSSKFLKLQNISTKIKQYIETQSQKIFQSIKKQQIKIISFGLSLKNPNQNIESYCGTLNYMAPEALSKLHTIHSQLRDGILLYKIVEGRCPFGAETSKELFYKIKLVEYAYRKKEVGKSFLKQKLFKEFLQNKI